jgi:hypothetical protein
MRPQAELGPKNRLPRGGNYCDFCGRLFVAKLYACNNFDWHGRPIFNTRSGRWAACEDCVCCIDIGAWETLVSHVMSSVHKRTGISRADLKALREDLRLLYLAVKLNLVPGEALTVQQPHYARLTG